MTVTNEYVVKGMTCEHCVAAVSAELAKLDGVGAVSVDLNTGQVTVSSDSPLDAAQVGSAVDEAGYELTS
ncbi:MAG: copper-binding protein [Acidimicrobiaceae bacterium]|nr:copper-binding protein [Acidimicrobiaceae bacterium]